MAVRVKVLAQHCETPGCDRKGTWIGRYATVGRDAVVRSDAVIRAGAVVGEDA
ncbi:MAG: hypothetical protein ACYDC0_16915 [Acidimicrobiales bacterium]